jgi:hypothetical protein
MMAIDMSKSRNRHLKTKQIDSEAFEIGIRSDVMPSLIISIFMIEVIVYCPGSREGS